MSMPGYDDREYCEPAMTVESNIYKLKIYLFYFKDVKDRYYLAH